jgi:hypothetical protein
LNGYQQGRKLTEIECCAGVAIIAGSEMLSFAAQTEIMYEILLRSHSGLRWVALLFIIGTVVKSAMALSSKQAYSSLDNKLSLFTLISFHTQLLLGFGLYFMSPLVKVAMESGMGVAMKDPVLRYWLVEHLSAMLIAIIFVTIGRISSKKATEDKQKFKNILIYFGLALFILIVSIPWPFREQLGRGWF